MPWDAQDRKRYEDEVLVAARAEGVPADLFTRYGIGPGLERRLRTDPVAFTEHVGEVCVYWRGLQSRRRSLKKVLVDLVAAHERLDREDALTHSHFRRVRGEEARRALTEWSDIVGGLTTTLLDRDTVRSMIEPVGVNEADAERVLADQGVRVVDRLPELPDAPPIHTFHTLRDNLRTRGLAFSPMVVFGEQRLADGFTVLDGFRLRDGATLDDEALSAATRRMQVEAMTDGKAAAENVLSILRSGGDPALRDAVALWEIVSDLRERPATLAEPGLVRHWVRRGLAEEEAMLLAAAVRHSDTGADQVARAEQDVRDLLADNRLRQAQAAAAGLPERHDLHVRLRERARQVEGLIREAERFLRGGEQEEAAHVLAAALDVAVDDDVLAARLGEVEPLPPRGAAARVDGRSVVVSWQPSPSLDGTITYRVARRTGRAGTAREVAVGELSGTEVTDTDVPVGAEAHYTVVAVRGGRGVSVPVPTPPVMITPEVSSFRMGAGERSVTASWVAPEEAVRVEVLRGEGAPPRGPGGGVRVETDGTGFRDDGVRPDVEYYYRVRAVYLTSNGHARGSDGLIRRASPGPRPAPVRDLSVLPDGGTGFVASWTQPSRGRIVLRVGAEPPEWPAGAVVGPDDLDSYGREVSGKPELDDGGRARAGLLLASGASHVLAVTVAGDQAVVGDLVRVTAAPPVEGLRAERFDTSVRLGWTWPDGIVTALVSWRPDGFAPDAGAGIGHVDGTEDGGQDRDGVRCGGELRCARHQYESDGGFEAPMGAGSVRVSVRTVLACEGEDAVSSPVNVTVPGRAVLGYHVEPVGLLRRNRLVHLVAEDACDMPEVAVVYAEGPVQPHTVAQGRVLATFPARHLAAGERVSVRVRPPRGTGPAWLMCFPADDDDRAVRLRQPSVKELRI